MGFPEQKNVVLPSMLWYQCQQMSSLSFKSSFRLLDRDTVIVPFFFYIYAYLFYHHRAFIYSYVDNHATENSYLVYCSSNIWSFANRTNCAVVQFEKCFNFIMILYAKDLTEKFPSIVLSHTFSRVIVISPNRTCITFTV